MGRCTMWTPKSSHSRARRSTAALRSERFNAKLMSSWRHDRRIRPRLRRFAVAILIRHLPGVSSWRGKPKVHGQVQPSTSHNIASALLRLCTTYDPRRTSNKQSVARTVGVLHARLIVGGEHTHETARSSGLPHNCRLPSLRPARRRPGHRYRRSFLHWSPSAPARAIGFREPCA